MKAIFCSDLHGNEAYYDRLLSFAKQEMADAIIIGGDLCPHLKIDIIDAILGQKQFIEGFLASFSERCVSKGIALYLIMGNDDFRANYPLLKKFNNLHNLVKDLGRWNITGYSFVPPHPFLLKDWEKPDFDYLELTEHPREVRTAPRELGTIREDLDKLGKLCNPQETIYVMHSPPYSTLLDKTYSGQHVGSRAQLFEPITQNNHSKQ
ncbi:MAG TPA: metallophosphoesterase [Candidatus Nanoarchaeia archaeon]|nr:metallophosphoesterase [Candidatus Nanoarchaeia archaeon]